MLILCAKRGVLVWAKTVMKKGGDIPRPEDFQWRGGMCMDVAVCYFESCVREVRCHGEGSGESEGQDNHATCLVDVSVCPNLADF